MALKTHNPYTPGVRNYIKVNRSGIYKGRPVKTLTQGITETGGRNNSGRTTIWTKSNRHKRRYRLIDFKRNKTDVTAEVQRIEYDPNRTSFIALIKYDDGELSYIIAPQGLKEGDKIISQSNCDVKTGNSDFLKNIPVGSIIHNIEMKQEKGAQLARAAGAYAQLVGKDSGYAQIKLRSGELRLVHLNCRATYGAVSNSDNQNTSLGKAGRSRWLGRKPSVRGVAMNPIDHPHGGGEGRTSGGRHPVTPWGQPTKGKRTRKNKKTERFILRKRFKK